MADKTIIEQMLEHLVNGEKAKAEELFHEYVVATSREIYESLIDSEISEESEDDDDEDEEDLDESSKSEEDEDDEDDEEMDENFEQIAVEGDDEDDEDGGLPGSEEKTDDMMGDIDDEGGEDMEEPATKGDVMSIKDDVAELLAAFDEFKAQEEGEGHEFDGDVDSDDMMGNNGPKMDAFEPELETVREYVEKVPAGHGAEKKGGAEQGGANTKSIVAGKNDMGGTTANIVSGRNGAESGFQGMSGDLKGSALSKGKPQLQDGGNINVPGGNAGKTGFKHKEPGHGAEKKGAGEQGGTNTTSLFRRK